MQAPRAEAEAGPLAGVAPAVQISGRQDKAGGRHQRHHGAADGLCFQGAVGEARWRPYFPL